MSDSQLQECFNAHRVLDFFAVASFMQFSLPQISDQLFRPIGLYDICAMCNKPSPGLLWFPFEYGQVVVMSTTEIWPK